MDELNTIGEIRNFYLLQGKASGWGHNTSETAKRVLKFLVDSDYGLGDEFRCDDIKEERLLHYLIDRRELGRGGKGMRFSTMNTEFLVLRRFFKWAHQSEIVPNPLLQTMTPPRADYQLFEPLTDDEIKRIFSSTLRSPQLTAIIALALECGLRRTELAILKLEDVNFDNQTVRVFGKRRKWRMVPFGNTFQQLVERHLVWRELIHPLSDTLFINEDGTAFTGAKLQARLATVRKNTRIKRLHWHLFRVTYANRFLAQGGDSFLLRENMGHTSFKAVATYIRMAGVSNYELSRKASLLDAGSSAFSLHKLIRPI
ncbi:MAG: tyrosine-type recombinase/integrase [Chloroflexi bacterium]|nr:tyrosine-type recombinase/integrase [Chloroflexota bacterium]